MPILIRSPHGRSTIAMLAVVSWLLTACAPERLRVPAARVAVPKPSAVEQATTSESIAPAVSGVSVGMVPATEESSSDRKLDIISATPPQIALPPRPDPNGRFSNTNSLTAAVEGMPARNFINYIFGELLKVNYILVDGTPGLDDPVTFSVQKPVSSRQLFKLVSELLGTRGISIVEKEGTYFIGPASAKTQQGLSIGYGRDPADVPDLPGELLQIIPLRFGPTQTLIDAATRFTNVQVAVELSWDAFFARGSRSEILKFLDLVRLFDRPSVKGSRIGLLSLTYIGPAEFVTQVTSLLANEGITVGGASPLTMVALDRLGGVVAFSSSDAILERLEFWAKQLDKPGQGPAQRYFVYQPKFARAADLGESLAGLLGGGGAPLGNLSRDTRSALGGGVSPNAIATADSVIRRDNPSGSGASASSGMATVSGDGITMSIDTRSNSLIFYATGPRYEALLPMIRRLDIPPKQIVLEAMIAEVSLTGEFQNGVEFAFREGKLSGGTDGNLGLPSGGLALNYNVGIGEQIRLRLQSSDARVNVLSNPILVVKDGVSATIQVGNDVPTVGATASDPIESNRTVTTVLYRNTGLTLSITPNINAQGSVLLAIQQSTTNTVPGSSGVAGAPIFFQRSINTEVVAGSGQTVFLAGLRSESDSTTSTKVPFVGSVPLIGKLFSSDSRRREKTELVVLITPRIVEDLSEWQDVMNGLRNSLQLLSIPLENVDGTLPRDRNR